MARPPKMTWVPVHLERLEDGPFDTSMGTAKVKTNATYGYLKALGNREGPHALASEWVGTSLADWFGLPVADYAIMSLEEIDCFDLPRGARTQPGPAFVSRFLPGRTWGKSLQELKQIENWSDITRLVVFDTWVRNVDRHPPESVDRKPNYANVYLAETADPEKYRLYAIDHTHCFDGGRELSTRLAEIGKIQDDLVYGLFPEFRQLIDVGELIWCKGSFDSLTMPVVRGILDRIPSEWEVSQPVKEAWAELILQRARYLSAKMDGDWGSDWRQSDRGD
jgi:hypothetical protein